MKLRGGRRRDSWDLTALLNAADPRAPRAERHLWLARLMEWLRHAPRVRAPADAAADAAAADAAEAPRTPPPVLRLRHLLNVLAKHPEHAQRVGALFARFFQELRGAGLFSDFGFGPRMSLSSEIADRLRLRLLPLTPDTSELAELFPLLLRDDDDAWIEAIDAATLKRLSAALRSTGGAAPAGWRAQMLDAMTFLVSAVRAAGFSAPLRQRMSEAALASEPFRRLAAAAEQVRQDLLDPQAAALHADVNLLRALLDDCRRAGASITEHLEEYGVSVDIVFEAEQMHERLHRIEQLLDCVLAPEPEPELQRLAVSLVRTLHQRRRVRALLAQHYAQLARKMAERSAETGEHYIARTRTEYGEMLRHAAGGGAVMSITTFAKFGIGALGLAAFWGGFWAGVNYSLSFVAIMLAHWTVATKQPAMTAPAMAHRLGDLGSDAKVEAFVDDVAHLLRTQAAGIFGNLALVGPLVLGAQLLAAWVFGAPPVDAAQAEYVLHSLTLLGPTALYAAFTGVLLFASSVIAGWVENWFVFHRLDSALAWNPGIVARLGAPRAARWAAWWRANISGVAANVSLGMMLGMVPVIVSFFGLPMEVRHVTLSTGQLAAAAGALGWPVLVSLGFWWCVAGIAATGLLNVGVSFWLAFKLAAKAGGVRAADRRRIGAALRRRLRERPTSFLWPR
ncbi:MAG TPA: recombinase [Rubrivivax sp.]|nr:recombinase [Rubrivivax sp.]